MAKKKSSSSILSTILTAVFTVVIGIVLISYFTVLKKKKKEPKASKAVAAQTKIVKKRVTKKSPVAKKRATREVTIYMSDPDGGYLRGEKRLIGRSRLNKSVAETINRLIADGGAETIPTGTKLININIDGKTAYADFNKALKANHSGGSTAEINTVYSIVNTVTLNFDEIDDVQILVEGNEVVTLAGHIDISGPIGPEKRVINP